MNNTMDQSRRRLFNRRAQQAIRPPWSRTDIEFTDICTRCNLCIEACETAIIFRGDGGFPEINFSQAECTFCTKCVSACKEPLFNDPQQEPWQLRAVIDNSCLALSGIWCQACKDACDARAITFTPAIGCAPQPAIMLDSCTGCGACVSPCPSQSISITAKEPR
ncbi:ferredoxin-type protein NapF [Shewanella algidipiscicola]|uniref:Ferredoxin-type protein NapF n=1 Tax=Shewanella algidipiscicola TaxID=614070 RepID=A0ABQ4PNX0_9GAMM|nr:ferredoxin-type protein NapF [Shewanella algidipiscicola]GIU50191.1 ferredoxin-type protein NapF [Shewanella algidipiscicola]